MSGRLFQLCALALPFTAPLAAQDRLGMAVAVQGSDVIALKPGLGRGPAAVLVYRAEGDGWRVAQRLVPAGSAQRGHALSASMVASDDLLLVGSEDPENRWAAHGWTLASGAWTSGVDIPLDSGRAGPVTVSLESVMRILQPVPRTIARHGDLVLVSAGGEVRLLERSGATWRRVAELPPAEGEPPQTYGYRIALASQLALVSVPVSNQVRVFSGEGWTEEAPIAPEGMAGSVFGAALALDGATLAVGAPRAGGAGAVVLYERAGSGGFTERARLAGSGGPGLGFGATIALRGDEMLVSAPGAARIHRFVREQGEWRPAGELAMPGTDRSWGFGAALALGADLAVVGAPGADAARGRVAVFRRGPDGRFSAGAWISLAGELVSATGKEIRCDGGAAQGFPCDNVDLQAFLSLEDLGGEPGERVSDLWGWTDPENGREYALVGRTGGLVFVDVTDAVTPRVLGWVAANPAGARDVKVYRDHAYFTGDGAGNHGLVVFDLTRLRSASGPPTGFAPDTIYGGIASAHNLAIDTASGFAVPVAASAGGETCGGGLHFIDIRNPKAPVFAGCYTDTEGLLHAGRTHDAQCVVYSGPDAEHRGKQVCFASNETALRIVDVSDKKNPRPLSRAAYPGVAYIHQGWLTEDQRYFYLDDELDELVGTTERTRTMIWDVADLDDPVLVGTYLGPDNATDHNLFIKGNRMYQANYQAGMRLVDISDPLTPVEVGFFDTTPYEGNPPGFNGAWTAYPYFASGNVIVSSMGEGLFILRPRATRLLP